MDAATVTAAARRFPLLGRPRPDCPTLPVRIKEVVDAAEAAMQKGKDGMHDAAHALNKAALIASDAGLADLAGDLCWQHIDAYRHLDRPLTILEARYLLEPVLNLARLRIRADQGTPALHLLKAMHQAISNRTDLTVAERTLPTAHLVGSPAERRQLREWVWLQLIGEGVRALALASRWANAAEHARTYRGIGAHLMEGRQAVIIAAILDGNLDESRKLLAETTLTQPWEEQVAACLHIMCTEPSSSPLVRHLADAMRHVTAPIAPSNYASYRARLGLTLATLANPTDPDLSAELLNQVANRTIETGDGYAARDVLSFRDLTNGLTEHQRASLRRITRESGLGLGPLPEASLHKMSTAADAAVRALNVALFKSSDAALSIGHQSAPPSGHPLRQVDTVPNDAAIAEQSDEVTAA